MKLAEINAEIAKVNMRMAAINEKAKDANTSTEELAKLAEETDSLIEKRNKLIRERTRLLSEVNQGEDAPVIENRSENNQDEDEDDPYSTIEYRKAFRNYIVKGNDNPILHRAEPATGTTVTSDANGVIIPTTITEKLFETNPNAGSLYARVTKTAFPSGISIPKELAKPKLQWLAENASGEKHKAGVNGSIIFAGFKFQVKVAISYELRVKSLAGFETAVVAKMGEAMAEGFDTAITVGTGSGMPKGILVGANYEKNAVLMNKSQIGEYSFWIQAWAKIPLKKQATTNLHINRYDWEAYVLGMKDSTGKVIALETMGFGGVLKPMFMGREVVLLEDQGVEGFDSVTPSATASAENAFAYFYCDADYWFNMNDQPRAKNYEDNDTDEKVQKITGLADGKSTDDRSLLVICRDVDATPASK